jgi:hypothetical protein
MDTWATCVSTVQDTWLPRMYPPKAERPPVASPSARLAAPGPASPADTGRGRAAADTRRTASDDSCGPVLLSREAERPPPRTWRRQAMRLATLCTCAALASIASALQFDLYAGVKHCFTEEIPPDAPVLVSYVVVDGDGDLPVTFQVRHVASSDVIYARDNIETNKFTFRTPSLGDLDVHRDPHQALPRNPPPANNVWRVRSEEGADAPRADAGSDPPPPPPPPPPPARPPAAGSVASGPQAPPSVGSAAKATVHQDLYSFCFGKTLTAGAGLFHLFPRRAHGGGRPNGGAQRRRVIFELKTGAEAQTRSEVQLLAKELHLKESELLFAQVHSHVAAVVRQVDDMRARARETDDVHSRTSALVSLYSILACVCILLSAGISAYGTQSTLRERKVI